MFKICVFPVAQLVLIISKYLVLFVNRFCSSKLLNGSILRKTHFNIIFLCEFFSDNLGKSIFWHCLLIIWLSQFIFQFCSLSCTETCTDFFVASSEMPCSITLECKVSQDSKNIPKDKPKFSDPWLPLKTARSSNLLGGGITFILYRDKTSTAYKTNMGAHISVCHHLIQCVFSFFLQ